MAAALGELHCVHSLHRGGACRAVQPRSREAERRVGRVDGAGGVALTRARRLARAPALARRGPCQGADEVTPGRARVRRGQRDARTEAPTLPRARTRPRSRGVCTHSVHARRLVFGPHKPRTPEPEARLRGIMP
eukprot:gene13551-biopygen3969